MKLKLVVLATWTVIVVLLLSIPMAENNLPNTGIFRYFDKIAHFGLFAVTGFLGLFSAGFFSSFRYRLLFCLVFSLLLAVGSEFGQSLLPYRDASLYDLLADLAGVLFGIVVFTLVYAWKKKL